MSNLVKIGIIGYGYWGINLVRNFSQLKNCKVKIIVDLNDERLAMAKNSYYEVKLSNDIDDIFNDGDIDAVVIATPVFSHFSLAKKALDKNKHVLIEKPMTSTIEEANCLIDLANSKNKILMVDHTFLYSTAVQKMKSMIDSGEVGKLKYFDSTRINLGLFQPDVNVLWDLAPHDISILNFLTNTMPYSVQATGISHTNNNIENIGYLTLNYDSDFIAHLNCSWSSPVKIRMTLIGGDKKMLIYNDIEPTEKIKVYDTRYNFTSSEEKKRIQVDYRVGDIYIPKIEYKEALSEMAKDFILSILENKTPISDCQSGLDVIRVLEASNKSIKDKGKEILI